MVRPRLTSTTLPSCPRRDQNEGQNCWSFERGEHRIAVDEQETLNALMNGQNEKALRESFVGLGAERAAEGADTRSLVPPFIP